MRFGSVAKPNCNPLGAFLTLFSKLGTYVTLWNRCRTSALPPNAMPPGTLSSTAGDATPVVAEAPAATTKLEPRNAVRRMFPRVKIAYVPARDKVSR